MQHSNFIPGQGPFKSYPRSGPGQAGLAVLDGWLAGRLAGWSLTLPPLERNQWETCYLQKNGIVRMHPQYYVYPIPPGPVSQILVLDMRPQGIG